MHRFAYYLSGNRAVAEDLTSETFVRALCVGSNLRVGTVKAYLFAIARNLYRDTLASQSHLSTADELPEPPDPHPGPHLEAEGRESFAHALRALQRLPESEREAIVLSIDRDLKYEQIAAILGCSIAAVKVRICRARLKLRAELAGSEKPCKK